MSPEIITCKPVNFASEAARFIATSLKNGGSIALSGGSTPGVVYEALSSTEIRDEVQWERVRVYLGDERFVSAADPRSNAKMVREKLLRTLTVAPQMTIFPNTDLSTVAECAHRYEKDIDDELKSHHTFTVMLLGIGDDGHTASLFPESPLLNEHTRRVSFCPHPTDGTERITLTIPAILQSETIVYLAAGKKKATVVKQALSEHANIAKIPAALYQQGKKARVVWFIDTEAASMLT